MCKNFLSVLESLDRTLQSEWNSIKLYIELNLLQYCFNTVSELAFQIVTKP